MKELAPFAGGLAALAVAGLLALTVIGMIEYIKDWCKTGGLIYKALSPVQLVAALTVFATGGSVVTSGFDKEPMIKLVVLVVTLGGVTFLISLTFFALKEKFAQQKIGGRVKEKLLARAIPRDIYEIVWDEFEKGHREKGLWAKSFAECDGDEKKAKALYLKMRAKAFIDAEKNL